MVTLVDFLRPIAAPAIVLGVLVFFHEFGHYWVARRCKVAVDAFSIGFGRALWHWRDRGGTEWKVGWLPLGGYVKLHGQDHPGEEDIADPAAFAAKPVGVRALIVAAGPAANILLAVLLFAALFAIAGRPVWDARVGSVLANSPAALAGLRPGDRILAVAGQKVSGFPALQTTIASRPGQKVVLLLRRAGQERSVLVHLDQHISEGGRIGVLGVVAAPPRFVREGPAAALIGGVAETWKVGYETLAGLGQVITGAASLRTIGGPLRIAELSGQAAQLGLTDLVSLIAVLSVNLGLLNLFPIPVLDGGHLLFFTGEALRGRPLPRQVQEWGFRAGLALVVTLLVLVTWNDLGLAAWLKRVIG